MAKPVRAFFPVFQYLASVLLLCPMVAWGQPGTAHADAFKPERLTAAWIRETEKRPDLDTVIRHARQGDFRPVGSRPRSFGIGSRPVWFHLPVQNPGETPLTLDLVAGATWIDRMDIYVVRDGRVLDHIVAGDGAREWQKPVSGLGYHFRHAFAPGQTEVFMRADTPDPLLVPLQVYTPEQFQTREERTRYTYGFVYGFLLALLLYNILLYLGLRQAQHRDYSLYLAVFLLMNLAYTGHGYNWFWPDAPVFQAYIILIAMVLFAVTGLRFAGTFLDLARHAPRLKRALRIFSGTALTLMAVMVGLDLQREAALLAFTVILAAFAIMLTLGCVALWRGFTTARYFLLAVISGSAGTIITTLTVWGWMPYSAAGFRAVEFGLLIEATLLALAVAYRVREHDRARERAEQLARVDPLTGLLNRRALMEQGEGLAQLSRRSRSELALVLLDLDHFKRINDIHGHAVGDRALMEVARVLREVSRRGDLAARWGGEEFILLLPGAGLDEAWAVAERVRSELADQPVQERGHAIQLRASFGIAILDKHENLTELIREADDWLYEAKKQGRDQVWFSTRLPDGPAPESS